MFCLSGSGSSFGCSVFPEIDLSDGEWEIGLVDFTTYNSIPNVEKGVNNLFHYGEKTVEIPTGSYEIDDITKFIEQEINEPDKLKIRGNNNTFQVEIYGSDVIDFSKEGSIGQLLGYSKTVLTPNKWHVSSNPVAIIKVNVIRVECNIARGSYQNGLEGHVVHEFYPVVPPGFKIVETPRNVIYLPVSVKRLENIIVRLCDQDNRLINLRDETVNIRLHLKRKNGTSI